jgi:putative proteasome-type protease
VLNPNTPLNEAAKCALVSMDSTLKSNLSVGLPLDMVVYEADSFQSDKVVCIDEHNPLLSDVARQLGPALARGVRWD